MDTLIITTNYFTRVNILADLFQKAILMSGSALSDWALVKNPILNTIQVGQSLNCGPGGNENFFDCLRRKRFTDLVSTKMYLPPFVTVFGPMVDGVMITNEPLPLLKEHKLMNKYATNKYFYHHSIL